MGLVEDDLAVEDFRWSSTEALMIRTELWVLEGFALRLGIMGYRNWSCIEIKQEEK